MTKITYFLLVIVVISISTCKNKDADSIVDLFENSKQLKYKLFKFQNDSNTLLFPVAIEIHDNMMVALDVKSSELFSGIDLQKKIITNSWGKVGQGPNELIGVLDFYSNYNNKGLNAWDPMLKRLNFYSYDSIFAVPNPMSEDLFEKIDKQGVLSAFYSNVLQTSEFRFLCLGNIEDKRFTLLDILTNKTIKTGDYPTQDKNENIIPILKNQAYHGMIRFNNQLKKIAYISQNSEMFEIFTVDDSGVKLQFGNYTTIPQYKQMIQGGDPSLILEDAPDGYGTNIAFSTTNKNIFILYQAYLTDQKKDNGEKSFVCEGNVVLVFDWNGTPVEKYILDCKVNNIFFSEGENRLYAIKNNPDPTIVYFDL